MKTNLILLLTIFSLIFISCENFETNVDTVETDHNIQLSTPIDNSDGIARSSFLQWFAVPYISDYVVILASDPGFRNIVLAVSDMEYWKNHGTLVHTPLLDSNRIYYWKVIGLKNDKVIYSSAIRSFRTKGGFYPGNDINIKIFGKHSNLDNNSLVAYPLISRDVKFSLGYTSSFWGNTLYMGHVYIFSVSENSNYALRSEFSNTHNNIEHFEFHNTVESNGSKQLPLTNETFIIKNIPFESETDSSFIFKVKGKRCKELITKIEITKNKLGSSGLSDSSIYKNTEWDDDSYISIELKK